MGDVYMAKLGINVGHETDKLRPVLVIQGNDKYLLFSEAVFVFPISSNKHSRKYRLSFSHDDIEIGKVQPGTILIQQGRTISTFRLGHKLGRMKMCKLREVQRKFEKLLYKNTPLEIRDRQGDKSRSP